MDTGKTPQLSIVLLFPDNSNCNERTLEHLHAQTVADQLEIVIVAVPGATVNESEIALGQFKSVITVHIDNMKSTAAARAAGVRAASAPIVALGEDHSFPDPRWAETFIAAHRGPWAVVGPAMANANPRHAISWANLAIEYGIWLDPATSGPAEHLPGHNSSYKRDVLLEYGDDLAAMLEAETVLHWDLRAKGYQLYFDANARTFHLNYTLLGPALVLRFLGGRLFGSARSRNWPMSKRLFYGLASPLIPLRRGWNTVRDLRRIGRFSPRMLALLAVLLACDAFGEMCGYFFGSGGEMARLSEMEFKRERFMKRDDIPVTSRHRQNFPVPAQ
jgi:hypothetical protein